MTLVMIADGPAPNAGPDARRILAACRRDRPLSIAEISAHLDLPPSLVMILIADLLDNGSLRIPTPAASVPPLALLRQVLDGLRALDP